MVLSVTLWMTTWHCNVKRLDTLAASLAPRSDHDLSLQQVWDERRDNLFPREIVVDWSPVSQLPMVFWKIHGPHRNQSVSVPSPESQP